MASVHDLELYGDPSSISCRVYFYVLYPYFFHSNSTYNIDFDDAEDESTTSCGGVLQEFCILHHQPVGCRLLTFPVIYNTVRATTAWQVSVECSTHSLKVIRLLFISILLAVRQECGSDAWGCLCQEFWCSILSPLPQLKDWLSCCSLSHFPFPLSA